MHWRYLDRGKVAHAHHVAWGFGSVCGIVPRWHELEDWHGDRDQRERDKVAKLPRCQRCTRLLELHPPVNPTQGHTAAGTGPDVGAGIPPSNSGAYRGSQGAVLPLTEDNPRHPHRLKPPTRSVFTVGNSRITGAREQ